MPNTISLSGGPFKIDALLGALHGHFTRILVTDEETARELIRREKLYQEEGGRLR
ncbi:MAG: hypothetical protein NTX88_08680 [Candidatus Atribacteria bacterium]|nr:hypothetical protein [Candidatus Atribacteria bacterium]